MVDDVLDTDIFNIFSFSTITYMLFIGDRNNKSELKWRKNSHLPNDSGCEHNTEKCNLIYTHWCRNGKQTQALIYHKL